jgi:phosphoglycerate dehydrogenase-like enzyme
MRPLIPRALIERGLLVTNWGDAITDTVAEAALWLILSCLRRSVQCQMNLHIRKGWREGITEPDSLLGRKVGLHGLGSVARHLTRFLAPFACQVSAYSPPVPDELFHQYQVRREASLDRLFAENDVIVELAALTPQTVGMVDERLLRLIRPGGVLVNVGRGPVIDGAALARVALEGKIWIGLDVTDPEPLPLDHALYTFPNVVITPHIASASLATRSRMAELAARNIIAVLAGSDPLTPVNRPAVPRR